MNTEGVTTREALIINAGQAGGLPEVLIPNAANQVQLEGVIGSILHSRGLYMEFYLVSTELRVPYEPVRCQVVQRLRNAVRDDLALVRLDRPIPGFTYGLQNDLVDVILASRLQGSSLFPVNSWPTYVYVCQKPGDIVDGFVSSALPVLDWGAIFRTAADALGPK